MLLTTLIINELPFMLEIPNGEYSVATSSGEIKLDVNGDNYALHTARYPQFANTQIAYLTKDEAANYIQQSNLSTYSFVQAKTIVRMTINIEREFTDEVEAVTEEQCLDYIQGEILKSGLRHSSSPSDNLKEQASVHLSNAKPHDIHVIKSQIVIKAAFHDFSLIEKYKEALNNLIRQCSYFRNYHWIYPLDENLLEGIHVQYYLENRFFESITMAGLVPSMMPARRIWPDMSEVELVDFRSRLTSGFTIPIEDELLLAARGLCYRMQYRSAIIECSAALEVTVENKLVEKMRSASITEQQIERELKDTRMDFPKRCNEKMHMYAGKSFEIDQSALWAKIKKHRKDYRHKIAHSDVKPDKVKTEEVIKDFTDAVKFIRTI